MLGALPHKQWDIPPLSCTGLQVEHGGTGQTQQSVNCFGFSVQGADVKGA